ncbi:DUF4150 domain-containing protein [Mesorhizobium sp. B1-1-5]|uniref:DUF4150 domain-containing protein n=1 Tax=Mesorhizobium sp. B1-1-5 TaxID=2589979 RepID=UPI001FEE77FA|nr:DUF4150 domain-containing protein [Mesorhizobium sp. B1-1-5]
MGSVYANGLEISAKAQDNKIIAAFPDTCFTPPENPATPPGVPIPYPTFGMDSDTDNGTSTVKIGGKTIAQKNLSYYTKTTGTEAGCAAKKGIITSTNTGKAYAAAWSSNVKAQGEPVPRNTDRATVNHASPQPNDGNGALVGGGGGGGGEANCEELATAIELQLTRNKRVENASSDKRNAPKKKGGAHGYLFMLAEQRCGQMAPGSEGWQTHQQNLDDKLIEVRAAIDAFNMAGCDLDDIDFANSRKEKDRDTNMKAAIEGIQNNDPQYVGEPEHLGPDHELCNGGDLADARADRTLNQITDIITA